MACCIESMASRILNRICLLHKTQQRFLNVSFAHRLAPKAAKKAGKGVDVKPTGEVPELNMTVCQRLNIYNNGEDPKIQDESQYPEWLWTLLDPVDMLTPDDKRYWRQIRKARIRTTNKLLKQRT